MWVYIRLFTIMSLRGGHTEDMGCTGPLWLIGRFAVHTRPSVFGTHNVYQLPIEMHGLDINVFRGNEEVPCGMTAVRVHNTERQITKSSIRSVTFMRDGHP